MIIKHAKSRELLEDSIIGACLVDPYAYPEAANILKPENFSNWWDVYNHPLIWKAMGELFPEKEIGIASIAHHIKINYDQDVLPSLLRISARVASSANLITHAFYLLEYDIRIKFLELLAELRESLSNDEAASIGAIQEAYMIVDGRMDGDLLITIEGLAAYLKSVCIGEDRIEKLEKFLEQIDRKAFQIKEQKTIDILLETLLNYGKYNTNDASKAAIGELTELASLIYLKKNATPDFIQQLQTIKKHLLA